MHRAGQHVAIPKSPSRRSFVPRGPLSAAVILLAMLTSGCGTDVYNERISRTKDLFNYHNTLDQALQGKWDRADFGVSMRIPRGFAMLPPPPPPKTLEDGTVEVAADTRHPAFLGIELPGLVEAWQMPTVGSLYVCSNHDRFLTQLEAGANAAKPEEFLTDLEAVLQEGLKFTLSPEEAKSPSDINARFREKIPTKSDFADPKDFTSISVDAGEIPNVPPLAARVYEIQAGPVQAAVICIFLKSAPRSPDVPVRLALETLAVSSETPRAATSAGGKGPGGANF